MAPSPSSAATYGDTNYTGYRATDDPDHLEAFVDHLVNWDYVAEVYKR
jgi:superoxide dismutase